MSALPPKADIETQSRDVRFVPKADVVSCFGSVRKRPVGDLRRGPPVREAWTNRGRVLRRLGEPNGGQDHGSHQLAAVPQSVLLDGSPKSRDLLFVFRAAYRSDTHARRATFGRSRIPLVLSVVRSSDGAYGCELQTHAAALNSESMRSIPRPESMQITARMVESLELLPRRQLLKYLKRNHRTALNGAGRRRSPDARVTPSGDFAVECGSRYLIFSRTLLR